VLSSAPPRPWLPAGVQEGACHTVNLSPVNCVTRSPTDLASLTATRAQTSTQQALPAAAQLPVELDHTVPGSFLMAPVKAGNGQGTRSGLACKRPSISRCRVALRHVRGSCTGDGSGWFWFPLGRKQPADTCGPRVKECKQSHTSCQQLGVDVERTHPWLSGPLPLRCT